LVVACSLRFPCLQATFATRPCPRPTRSEPRLRPRPARRGPSRLVRRRRGGKRKRRGRRRRRGRRQPGGLREPQHGHVLGVREPVAALETVELLGGAVEGRHDAPPGQSVQVRVHNRGGARALGDLRRAGSERALDNRGAPKDTPSRPREHARRPATAGVLPRIDLRVFESTLDTRAAPSYRPSRFRGRARQPATPGGLPRIDLRVFDNTPDARGAPSYRPSRLREHARHAGAPKDRPSRLRENARHPGCSQL